MDDKNSSVISLPLPSPEAANGILNPRRLEQWTLAFLLLGLLARCVRYFLRFPLWEDECFLCANLADRDFRGLLDPLNFHQVCPLLFLWLQLAVTKVFGYSEMTLRLLPFLASIGSMLLFYRLSKICLTGLPRLIAVAVFSVTYAMVRYSAEAKPYGIDLLISLVFLNIAINWLRFPESNRWLWILAGLAPLAVGMSYGSVMIGGGLSLTIAYAIWRQQRWKSIPPWLTFSAVLVGSFLLFYFLSIRVQTAAELDAMRGFWIGQFPPLDSLGAFVSWFFQVHCGDLLSYPVGGSPFQSSLSSICWVAGLIALARRRFGIVLIWCLAPQALTFLAATMKRYPYGGHIRLNLYLAPFMCMVIGYGAAAMLAWLERRGRSAVVPTRIALILLAVVGVTCIGRDLARPYKNISDERARGFAQWFWFNAEQDSEVVCLTSDLGIVLSTRQFTDLNFSAQYLCNQRIYSPRHAARRPVQWDSISASHPLRCVLYRMDSQRIESEAALEEWMREMDGRYDLVERERFPMIRLGKLGDVREVDAIEIFRFVPKIEGIAGLAREEEPISLKGLAPAQK